MKNESQGYLAWSLVALILPLLLQGCKSPCASDFYQPPAAPQMLGSKVDDIMRSQEENAEASKYVIYQHEFLLNQNRDGRTVLGIRLNEYGQDHLKQIAQNLRTGSQYPVVVERSRTSVRPDTAHKYPLHFNPELDMRRRDVVVRALVAMGIDDANQKVVVAPAIAQGYQSSEAEAAYRIGLGRNNRSGFGGFGFGGSSGTGGF